MAVERCIVVVSFGCGMSDFEADSMFAWVAVIDEDESMSSSYGFLSLWPSFWTGGVSVDRPQRQA